MTQKRRARLAYAEALALCEGREPRESEEIDGAVIEEVLSMVAEFRLRPTTLVGYVRDAADSHVQVLPERRGLRSRSALGLPRPRRARGRRYPMSIFDGFEDLTGTFTVADVFLSMVVSFAASAARRTSARHVRDQRRRAAGVPVRLVQAA